MSHKDRSIANMRQEAKRIYHQRREINRLQKALKNLEKINDDKSNVIIADMKEILKYKRALSEIREYCNLYTRLSAKDILEIIEKNI